MISRETMDKARELLLQKRASLQRMRDETEQSSARLSQDQVELEELAQQEKMHQQLEDQDRVTRDQLYEVNMALQRIEAGTYGLCHECGEEISQARLLAVPWTTRCINCAAEEEGTVPGQPLEVPERGPSLAEDLQGLTGEELCNAIMERLRYDNRVALDDLEVRCQGQKVILSGALPSSEHNEILYEIIEDSFGVHEIEDNVRIDPRAWQRKDRAPDSKVPEHSEDEFLLEGRPQESDPFSAIKEGEAMDPEDKLVYEKQENPGVGKD